MVESELIKDFINTHRLDTGEDAFDSPAALSTWCASHGLSGGGVAATAADLREAVELRESLRMLLLANNGIEIDTGPAVASLDRLARHARIELHFDAAGSEIAPRAPGVGGAIGHLLLAVHTTMADGSWPRLKACRARDCEWAFIDRAKNHSREWCSMQVCGNREKARVHRARLRSVPY